MNKIEFIKAVADKTGATQKDIAAILDGMHAVTCETLRSGDELKLTGVLTISKTTRHARTGRNPRTGEAMEIPAKDVVTCKVSKAFLG